MPCVTAYPLGQEHCFYLGLSVSLTSTCRFFYSTWPANFSGFGTRSVVRFLFSWFFSVAIAVGQCCWSAVTTWIKSLDCSSHPFWFTENWGWEVLAGRKKKVSLGFRRLWDAFNKRNWVQLCVLWMLNKTGSCHFCVQIQEERVSYMLLVVGVLELSTSASSLSFSALGSFQRLQATSWMHFLPLVCNLQI